MKLAESTKKSTMMYAFYERLSLNANDVEYFGFMMPDVGLDINVYNKACNDLFLCDGEFYPDSEDIH